MPPRYLYTKNDEYCAMHYDYTKNISDKVSASKWVQEFNSNKVSKY